MNQFLVRQKPGSRSRFELDTELSDFLNNVDRYYSIKELRELLIARFGRDRVPSKSSLHRYLQKITKSGGKP